MKTDPLNLFSGLEGQTNYTNSSMDGRPFRCFTGPLCNTTKIIGAAEVVRGTRIVADRHFRIRDVTEPSESPTLERKLCFRRECHSCPGPRGSRGPRDWTPTQDVRVGPDVSKDSSPLRHPSFPFTLTGSDTCGPDLVTGATFRPGDPAGRYGPRYRHNQ